MIIHRASGYKLLLRMLAAALGPQQLRGFPAARTAADKRDEALLPFLGVTPTPTLTLTPTLTPTPTKALLPFLGEPHDASLGARCGCALRLRAVHLQPAHLVRARHGRRRQGVRGGCLLPQRAPGLSP